MRAFARHWNLDVWDKPAAPCLSSRLAPGVAVTTERTARVESAERLLRDLGFGECRVRLHEGELARIEVPAAELDRLADPSIRESLVARLSELGFRYVTLDLQGFRSGSLNELVSLETEAVVCRGRDIVTLTPLSAAQALDTYFLDARSRLLGWLRCSTGSTAVAVSATRGWPAYIRRLTF